MKKELEMPNVKELVDRIGGIVTSKRRGRVCFPVLHLKYACSQCNFSFVGGATTGSYPFATGFYGLADMPSEFYVLR